jgi:hypothetical protein
MFQSQLLAFIWIPCWSNPNTLGACIYTLELQSEYTLCLNPSRHDVRIWVHHTCDWFWVHIVLEYESMLDIHHYSLLYKPCWLSRSYFRERESIFFYRCTPTLSGKSVCGKFLIRSILVLLFNFEVPWKNIKNSKKNKKRGKKKSKRQHRRGFVWVLLFFCAVVLSNYLGVQARVSSTV